jgi:recombination associated protein RdgC
MFRNLRFYKINEPWPESEADLSEKLAARKFIACNAYSDKSAGWEPPVELEEAFLCRRVGKADLLQLRTQTRVMPPAAVNEALAERVAEFRQRTGDLPTPGEKRRLKEELKDELMPKALLRSQRTRACFLLDESVLAIDANSPSMAEGLLDSLRPCFGRFECFPLEFRSSPAELIRRIFMGERVAGFDLGRECRLQDPRDRTAVGAWRNIELDDDAIRRHVLDGMRLTHLGIGFQQTATAVLAEDGVVSKLKILMDEDTQAEWDQDPAARLDADFALLAGTATNLLGSLKKALGGYKG